MTNFLFLDGGAKIQNVKTCTKVFDQGMLLYGLRIQTD